MSRLKFTFIALTAAVQCLCLLPLSAENIEIGKLDSLLSVFEKTNSQAVASQIVGAVSDEDIFFGAEPKLEDGLSPDRQQLLVLYSAERWMNVNSYFAEALKLTDRIIELAGQLVDNGILSTVWCDRTYCLYKLSRYAEAIESGKQAMALCQQTDNTLQLSRAYLYLSLVNYGLRNYDEAVVLVERSIAVNSELGVNQQTHNAYGIACELYCGAGQLDKAIEYGLKATQYAQNDGNEAAVANHLTQLSYAYDRVGDYQKGLDAANRAIEIVRRQTPLDRNQLAISLEFKAWNLIDMKRHSEAVDALREAIELEQAVGNTQAVCYDYRTLYEALEPDDPRGALAALKRYTVMADSLHSLQLKQMMTQANAELRNDELQQENNQTKQRQRLIMWTSLIIFIVLTVIIASLLFAFRQKRKTAEALRRLSKARETFFTNVTHEFRTPLTVILGIGQQLRDAKLNDAQLKEAGEMIGRQGGRLLTLVNQILDISKLKASVTQLPLQEGDMAAYVAMVVETYQQLAQRKHISITFTAVPEHIFTAFAADYVEKVVGNLVGNSIKFTAENGHVEVSLSLVGNIIRLTVADNGCGINEQDLKHIFEPFYQANETDAVGTGIGLALVKQIVTAIGGEIKVDSRLKEGTTFVIDIPHKEISFGEKALYTTQPKAVEVVDLEADDDIPATDAANDGRPTILLVEDNQDVSRYIAHLLEADYNLLFASDGEQAIEVATMQMPDIVITDVMMPKVDGLTLCRTLREKPETDHIPIIVVTAKATEADRIEGLKAGADAYLIKPFNADELRICIDNLSKQRERLRRRYSVLSDLSKHTVDDQQTESLIEISKPTSGQADEQMSASAMAQAAAFMEKLEKVIARFDINTLTVETLAAEMCMSLRTLQRKMIAVVGTSPKKYILEAKLKKACLMKEQNPQLTFDELATACGFHDASHFIHAFQNTFKESPKNYFSAESQKNVSEEIDK